MYDPMRWVQKCALCGDSFHLLIGRSLGDATKFRIFFVFELRFIVYSADFVAVL